MPHDVYETKNTYTIETNIIVTTKTCNTDDIMYTHINYCYKFNSLVYK